MRTSDVGEARQQDAQRYPFIKISAWFIQGLRVYPSSYTSAVGRICAIRKLRGLTRVHRWVSSLKSAWRIFELSERTAAGFCVITRVRHPRTLAVRWHLTFQSSLKSNIHSHTFTQFSLSSTELRAALCNSGTFPHFPIRSLNSPLSASADHTNNLSS
jgi:hypothetical protein